MTAISLTPGLTEVTVFGGAPHYNPNQLDRDVHTIAATIYYGKQVHVVIVYTQNLT